MTDDLIAFLRAALDEDERVARAAVAEDGVWTRECGHIGIDDEALPPGHDFCTVVSGDIHIYDEGGHTPEQAEHIARHDPARVLRQVERDRRILDLHPHQRFATLPEEWPDHWRAEVKQAFPGTDQPYVGCERDSFNTDYEVVQPDWWCETVRLLALPYADRPGYRDEWAPTSAPA